RIHSIFIFTWSVAPRALRSFPTRRSSDLELRVEARAELEERADPPADGDVAARRLDDPGDEAQERRLARPVAAHETDRVAGLDLDRKSTRLNSSHVAISYAVFCLKKKKNT